LFADKEEMVGECNALLSNVVLVGDKNDEWQWYLVAFFLL